METVSSQPRVLVVDQQVHCRIEIDGMLKRADYSTVLSSGSGEAIAHIEKDPPYDLVLSDLMTAGLNGHGLLERMRQVQPDTPLVLVTPSSYLDRAIAAERQGAYDYLLKPIEKDRCWLQSSGRLIIGGWCSRTRCTGKVWADGKRPDGDAAPGDFRPGAILRHHAGGAGRRA